MITENLSILKINKLASEKQFNKALKEGRINENEFYLTPDDRSYSDDEIDAKINSKVAAVQKTIGDIGAILDRINGEVI